MENTEQKLRTVLLAAPSYDGTINVWHATALAETCKIGLTKNINVIPVYMSYDSLVQRARNDIFKLAIDMQVDDLFFVDSDQDWNPADFFRMLDHDVEIVGAPVIKKSDAEQYNVKMEVDSVIQDNGLMSVISVGTGFMRISKSALSKIWETCQEYQEPHKEQPSRSVFEVKIVDGVLYAEDVSFCQKWRDLGGTVWLDPMVNCAHSGHKRWLGNFYEWWKVVKSYNRQQYFLGVG